MNGRLYWYLNPVPSGLEEEAGWEWTVKNWGSYTDACFDTGWMLNNSVLLKVHGGSADRFNEMLKSHNEIESFTVNYLGYTDKQSKPDFIGIWKDDRQVKEEAPEKHFFEQPF